MQYLCHNIPFKSLNHLVFILFILAQNLQKQDILFKFHFSYNVANHKQAFLIFYVDVLEFPQLMFWANKNIQRWKTGSFWIQLIYFTTVIFQIDLLSRGVNFKCDLEMESWFLWDQKEKVVKIVHLTTPHPRKGWCLLSTRLSWTATGTGRPKKVWDWAELRLLKAGGALEQKEH